MMEMNQTRKSLQKRMVELVSRQLPDGWGCAPDGDGLRLVGKLQGQLAERAIPLHALYEQVEAQPERRREALHAWTTRIAAMVQAIQAERRLIGQEDRIFPVVRHKSFAAHQGETLLVAAHTAETIITYALDQELGYLLIDQEMLHAAGWTREQLHERALANLQRLEVPVKSQQVGPHTLHFISPADGYAASRVLREDILQQFAANKSGKWLGVAVPHQDVLIVGDLHDEQGAQLLLQVTYDFAAKGSVPICPVPFFYENGRLDPYLVVQHKSKRPT